MKMTHIFAALLCGTILSLPTLAAPVEGKLSVAGAKDVTAAQVNGTWECRLNTLKIWALGNGKLQVGFEGTYEYKSPQGPMANTGQGGGIATIEGDTATFRPEGAEEECKIALKFTGGKLIVKQVGICGFGNRVNAEGTYKKTSRKKPNFDSEAR
jgi:hypothetical protein